ncbi:MAG TPA: hypothetical protein VG013_33805 [Gemmataceae bacterium]|jgi:hypothetical protein|nr:hypothetical protein [Gemmataceae bacterium]
MEAHLTGAEAGFVKRIADLYLKSETHIVSPSERGDLTEELGMTPENRQVVLAATEALGIVKDAAYDPGTGQFVFEITPRAVQAARAIQWQETVRKSESRDIVAELKSTAKANPVLAWAIIGFVILTAAVTMVNQVWQLVDRIVK